MSRFILPSLMAAMMMLGVWGCESSTPDASQNAALRPNYSEGTGVSSSGYDTHPRFYTGANSAAPTTQPSR